MAGGLPGIKLSIQVTQFFDKAAVIRKLAPATLKYLRRAGGTTRRIALNSIKRKGFDRKAPKNKKGKAYQKWLKEIRERPASPPGSPPFTHDGTFKDPGSIMFGLDREGAVIGFMEGKVDDLAELHEFGGRRVTKTKQIRTFKNVRNKRGQFATEEEFITVSGTVTYPARPTMGPALDKVEDRLPEFWRDAIK